MSEERDRGGDPLYGVEVLRIDNLPSPKPGSDQAMEYSIRDEPDAISGLLVYGRYQLGWEANPSLRPVVRDLLRRLGIELGAKQPDGPTHAAAPAQANPQNPGVEQPTDAECG